MTAPAILDVARFLSCDAYAEEFNEDVRINCLGPNF